MTSSFITIEKASLEPLIRPLTTRSLTDRLLELEQRESRERTPELGRRGQERTPELGRRRQRGQEADTASISSLTQDSGCSSQTTLEDILDAQKDFRVSI